jgi:polar amino acid transport system permease protein
MQTPQAAPVTSRTEPRQYLDVRPLARNLVRRQSWFIVFLILDVLVLTGIRSDPVLTEAWNFIWPGIRITVQITLVAFVFAVVIGLITALARLSRNIIIYNAATLYVELFRGLPLLVIILIFAFVVVPKFVDVVSGTNSLSGAGSDVTTPPQPNIPFLDDMIQRMVGIPENQIQTTVLRTRDIDPLWRIMFAFALTYGAFMSEVFRAGIESIGRGQMEAARSLGMNYA